MRFIVFYNDHPKVKDYSVRVWDNMQVHPNFIGEMTHPAFIRHYHINPQHVSSVGYIHYNEVTDAWEEYKKSPTIQIQGNAKRKEIDIALALTYVQEKYGNDAEAKQNSLREQRLILLAQKASLGR